MDSSNHFEIVKEANIPIKYFKIAKELSVVLNGKCSRNINSCPGLIDHQKYHEALSKFVHDACSVFCRRLFPELPQNPKGDGTDSCPCLSPITKDFAIERLETYIMYMEEQDG